MVWAYGRVFCSSGRSRSISSLSLPTPPPQSLLPGYIWHYLFDITHIHSWSHAYSAHGSPGAPLSLGGWVGGCMCLYMCVLSLLSVPFSFFWRGGGVVLQWAQRHPVSLKPFPLALTDRGNNVSGHPLPRLKNRTECWRPRVHPKWHWSEIVH